MEETKQAIDRFFEKMWMSRKMDVATLFVAALLGVVFDWNIVEMSVFILFIASILFSIPSRFLALPALFFLSFTPVLLLLNRKESAEEFAVYAYYFLVMAVVRGIIEIRKG